MMSRTRRGRRFFGSVRADLFVPYEFVMRLPRSGEQLRWSQEYGAAADVVVHSWVNQNKDPKGFKTALPGSNIEYHRFLSYSHRGSEFICLASRSQGNKYERGGNEWEKLKERADKASARGGGWKDWRRKPYTPSDGAESRSNFGYEKQLSVAESSWCEESDTEAEISMIGSVVFGREPPKGKSGVDL